jgi:Histidine kinase-like ATPase domain
LATSSFEIGTGYIMLTGPHETGITPHMEPLVLRVPPDPAVLATLRSELRIWLEALEAAEEDVAAIVAACSEVAADAIEYAPSQATGAVEFTAVLAGADVVVRCAAPGDWRIGERPSRYVAALLVDDVSIEPGTAGTAVVLRKSVDRGLRNLREL